MGGKIPPAALLHRAGTLHRLRKAPLLPFVSALGHLSQRVALSEVPRPGDPLKQ